MYIDNSGMTETKIYIYILDCESRQQHFMSHCSPREDWLRWSHKHGVFAFFFGEVR